MANNKNFIEKESLQTLVNQVNENTSNIKTFDAIGISAKEGESITQGSLAFGTSISGCKGYYIQAIDFTNKQIYLGTAQPQDETGRPIAPITGVGAYNEDFVAPYAVGDYFYTINKSHFLTDSWLIGNKDAQISAIDHNIITWTSDIGYTSLEELEEDQVAAVDDYSFMVPSNPSAVYSLCISDMGYGHAYIINGKNISFHEDMFTPQLISSGSSIILTSNTLDAQIIDAILEEFVIDIGPRIIAYDISDSDYFNDYVIFNGKQLDHYDTWQGNINGVDCQLQALPAAAIEIKFPSFAFGENCKSAGRGSFVSGRDSNAFGDYSFVAGRENLGYHGSAIFGYRNRSRSSLGFIAGGRNHTIEKDTIHSAIVGGRANKIWQNVEYGLITGGYGNNLYANYSAIIGGKANTISSNNQGSFIGAGGGDSGNTINASYSGIIGGFNNNITQTTNYDSLGGSFIGGGSGNTIKNYAGCAAFGINNTVQAKHGFVAGLGLQATTAEQAVFGRYNDTNGNAKFIVGNGSGTDDPKNVFMVMKEGQAIAGISTTSSDTGLTLTTKDYVDKLESRIQTLEGDTGTGTIYFYDSVVAELLDFMGGDDYQEYAIEIDGENTLMNEEFFHNKCTHVDFGGDSDEGGAYLFFYEKSVKLSFYEAFPVYVNGDDLAMAYAGPQYYTFNAPEVLHVTLHD